MTTSPNVIHLFNSSSVSGPETLALPALAEWKSSARVLNLREERLSRLSASDPLGQYSRSLGLGYFAIPVKRRWDREAVRQTHIYLREQRPDVVHAHDVKASTYLLHAARDWRARPFRIVSTHHGVLGRPDLKTRLYEWYYRKRILPSFDKVLAVSSADYALLRGSGIADARLALHLNGVDRPAVAIEDRPRLSQAIRRRWLPGVADAAEGFWMGVVGRLSVEKDHARVLRILAELARRPVRREWQCLMFGGGPLEAKLRARTRELRLEGHVRWMGYRPDLGAELAGFDLLLSFSKAEGLPVNLLEAGWAATPVMATGVGGVLDLIPDGRYGVVCPADEPPARSAERLEGLLAEPGESGLREQGRAFQERVSREFNRERWLLRLREIYADCLSPEWGPPA
ncbi:MAG TPA: glycosyltransferase [Elusimicrobiota bacterium]|nr:glycosyltransferase [Elusimicrobiota bacterium]